MRQAANNALQSCYTATHQTRRDPCVPEAFSMGIAERLVGVVISSVLDCWTLGMPVAISLQLIWLQPRPWLQGSEFKVFAEKWVRTHSFSEVYEPTLRPAGMQTSYLCS